MRRMYTCFSTYHPILLMSYAIAAPILAMVSGHPVYLAVNLFMALVIHGFYFGAEKTAKAIALMSLFILLVGLLNFSFNTRGMHELFRIGQHPFTWESLLYGFFSGGMLAAVLLWFQCFNKIISNEKFLYLFGKRLPGTALLLSMILKLFPDLQYRMHSIRYADKEPVGSGRPTLFGRMKKSFRHISALLEWSMEDSIEMADSMKARGYGEKNRTSWQVYRWSAGDGVLAAIMSVTGGISLAAIIWQSAGFRWFPVITSQADWRYTVAAVICNVVFLGIPILAELMAGGAKKW